MNKYKCLYDVCGWQGGTIHQIAEELQISVDDILSDKPPADTSTYSDYMKGQYAYSTCSLDFVQRKLKPMYTGNPDYWKGYIRAAFIEG